MPSAPVGPLSGVNAEFPSPVGLVSGANAEFPSPVGLVSGANAEFPSPVGLVSGASPEFPAPADPYPERTPCRRGPSPSSSPRDPGRRSRLGGDPAPAGAAAAGAAATGPAAAGPAPRLAAAAAGRRAAASRSSRARARRTRRTFPVGGAGAPPVYGDRSPTTFHQLPRPVMRIGRALENELVVSDLQVSRHHAEFHATPTAASRSATWARTTARTSTASRSPRAARSCSARTTSWASATPRSVWSATGSRSSSTPVTSLLGPSSDRHGRRRQADPQGRLLRRPGEVADRRHRSVRFRQVDAPEGAHRLPSRQPGRRPLRQPEPLQAVRRAASAHRSGPAGRHPAQGADRQEGPQVRGQAALPRRHHGRRARGPYRRGAA
ncbi:hypothetical protein SALBM311S_09436 [Streptomyces alboniger]